MFKLIAIFALIALAAARTAPRYSHQASHHGDERNAETVNLKSDVRPDGFDYAYDTSNGIHGTASGDVNGNIRGDNSWTSPEGEQVSLQYVADEYGYHPAPSAWIPTPPPIPDYVLRAIAYIESHPDAQDRRH